MKKIYSVVLSQWPTSCLLVLHSIFKQLQTTFFSKTTEAIVIEFHLKYDQTPGFQNYKFALGQESKMAAITKNSKTIKINFFSGTIKHNWL